MSNNENNNEKKEPVKEYKDKNEPAPPLIKTKKHLKYKIIHNTFKKNKTEAYPFNKTQKDLHVKNERKTLQKITPLPLNDDWSIFSPNFTETPTGNENSIYNEYKTNNTIETDRYSNNFRRSLFNIPHFEDDKILKLEKEINGLKETNQNILNLIMEKEKENRELINSIDKFKIESIEKLSNYLNFIEELGKKFKFSNDEDEEIYLDIKNNNNETSELNKELSRNNQLKTILNKKDEEFNDINNAIKKLIFNDNSNNTPSLEESELKLKNDEKKVNDNINKDKDDQNEIINIKNDYNKLKDEYNNLLKKFKQNEKKNKGKNRIKFIYKDLPQKIKQKYESEVKKLIEENEEIKKNYNKEIEELNITLGSLKVEFLNKQFENEIKILESKRKIKLLIKQCKSLGIVLSNDLIKIK